MFGWLVNRWKARSGDADDIAALREAKDAAYAERNKVVIALARVLNRLGYNVVQTTTDIEGWKPEWHSCLYIETPLGQLSWHVHESERPLLYWVPFVNDVKFDGHTTGQKYARLHNFVCELVERKDFPGYPEVHPLALVTQKPEGWRPFYVESARATAANEELRALIEREGAAPLERRMTSIRRRFEGVFETLKTKGMATEEIVDSLIAIVAAEIYEAAAEPYLSAAARRTVDRLRRELDRGD